MNRYINVGDELGKLRIVGEEMEKMTDEIEKMKEDIQDNLKEIVKRTNQNQSESRLKSKELEERIEKLEGKSGGRRTRGKKRTRRRRKSRRKSKGRKRRKSRRKRKR